MFLPLTDLLTCPHCGPETGLILLADQIEDRRVLAGALGCPSCQRRYPISAGHADLRRHSEGTDDTGADEETSADEIGTVDREEALRLAALLGLAEGTVHYLLIMGPGAIQAPAIAALVDGVEVLAVECGAEDWPEERGVSRLAVDEALPLYSGALQGVALTTGRLELLEEVVRVLSPVGRLVIDPAPEGIEGDLATHGLKMVMHEGDTLVAVRA